MAENVTISIPTELSERLEAVKGSFNVSGVCQEAIRREVIRQELLSKENGKMQNTIKRLKAEKKEHDTKDQEQGFNDGYESAKKMHYTELTELAKENTTYATAKSEGITFKGKKEWSLPSEYSLMSNKYLQKVDGRFEEDFHKARSNNEYLNEYKYKTGWPKGVKAFWEKIKDKL